MGLKRRVGVPGVVPQHQPAPKVSQALPGPDVGFQGVAALDELSLLGVSRVVQFSFSFFLPETGFHSCCPDWSSMT